MAFRKRSRKHKGGGAHDDSHGLMITPLLDLFVALIPFLIMSVVLTRLNTVDVAISKPGVSNEAVQTEQELTILLRVYATKAELSVNNQVVSVINKTVNEKDWLATAHAKLVELKKKHPKELRIFIEAGERVSIETLMGFMDSARELRSTDGEILREENGKNVKLRYLFPKVILKGVYS